MEDKNFLITGDLLASQSQRFGNYLIDLVVQYVIAIVIGVVVVLVAQLSGFFDVAAWFNSMNKLQEYALGIVISIVYYGLMETLFARSIGKYITKTVVVREDGSKPDATTILKRTLCRLIPFDALSFLGNGNGWHDSISDTYVVKKNELERAKEMFDAFDQIGVVE